MNRCRPGRVLLAAMTIPFVIASCGNDDDPGAPTPPTAVATTDPAMTDPAATEPAATEPAVTEPAVTEPAVTEPALSEPADTILESAPADLPAWQTAELTDVDGESFTLADYVGTPLLVESFATWCSKCLAQLGDTQAAAAEVGDEAAVVALSVETDLDPSEVADYAADNGFDDIRFAVLTPAALAAFADDLGTSVANPPATPKVVIDANGEAGELTTGAESAEAIIAALRAAA